MGTQPWFWAYLKLQTHHKTFSYIFSNHFPILYPTTLYPSAVPRKAVMHAVGKGWLDILLEINKNISYFLLISSPIAYGFPLTYTSHIAGGELRYSRRVFQEKCLPTQQCQLPCPWLDHKFHFLLDRCCIEKVMGGQRRVAPHFIRLKTLLCMFCFIFTCL